MEKLDRLVRFCIKEKVLSLDDLDRIWSAQDGKHEIIVKNIHDMLVKLAWDFSPEQLDYLFGCFQVCITIAILYVHVIPMVHCSNTLFLYSWLNTSACIAHNLGTAMASSFYNLNCWG